MNTSAIDRSKVAQELREVIDPELGVNIVDLGLIYNIYVEDDTAIVEFTATTPGCPMRRFLQQQVEEKLSGIQEVQDYEARMVWDPEWNVDMIKEDVEFFAVPPPQQRT